MLGNAVKQHVPLLNTQSIWITAAVQRIADTGNVMPNHPQARTSTAVARCV